MNQPFLERPIEDTIIWPIKKKLKKSTPEIGDPIQRHQNWVIVVFKQEINIFHRKESRGFSPEPVFHSDPWANPS